MGVEPTQDGSTAPQTVLKFGEAFVVAPCHAVPGHRFSCKITSFILRRHLLSHRCPASWAPEWHRRGLLFDVRVLRDRPGLKNEQDRTVIGLRSRPARIFSSRARDNRRRADSR